MPDFSPEEFSDIVLDVFTEISNIGTGNAVTSISAMLSGSVSIDVPDIRLLDFKELSDVIGGAENTVIGILVNLQKEIDGMMMFIMDIPSASLFVNNLMGRPEDTPFEAFSEMDLSAVKELGNVVAGSYLSALAELTGLSVATCVPEVSIDMAGAILSVPAIAFGEVSDQVLLIRSEIHMDENTATGYFILTPTKEAFDKIFEILWG